MWRVRTILSMVFLTVKFCFPLQLSAQTVNQGTLKRIKKVALNFQKSQFQIDSVAKDSLEVSSNSSFKYVDLPKVSLPLKTLKVNSFFGDRVHPVTGQHDFHKGVDLAAKAQIVYCIQNGIVEEVGFNQILGNYIRINHGISKSIYGHLSRIFPRKGDNIYGAMPIGITGTTGRVTGEHLHLSIKVNKTYINPMRYLAKLFGLQIKI